MNERQNAGTADDEQNAAPNAEQTASAGIPPNVPMPGTMDPEIGRNDFPVESLHHPPRVPTVKEWSCEPGSVSRTDPNGSWQGPDEDLATTG